MTVADTVAAATGNLSSTLNDYASTHQDGLIALLIFGGLLIAFTGRTILKAIVFLIGFTPATAFLANAGIALVSDSNTNGTTGPVAFAIVSSIAFGILAGVVMLKVLFGIATFVICAGLGAVLVLDIHLFIIQPVTGSNAEVALEVITIFAALISGILSIVYPDMSIILGTAFDGAGLAMFSLANFLGHRPHVFGVNSTDKGSTWWTLCYASATLLLGTFATVIQHRLVTGERLERQMKEDKRRRANDEFSVNGEYQSIPDEETGSNFPEDEPKTPPLLEEEYNHENYGATDNEHVYAVVNNLGAPALPAYAPKDSKTSLS